MSTNAKKRLCWNCEGSVSITEETCPFCGVSVVLSSLDGTGTSFTPPYTPSQSTSIPRSPYSFEEEKVQVVAEEEEAAPSSLDEFKYVVLAVTLLLSGSVFFLFGLALALFSNQGIFSLHWNSNLWYVYTLFGLPSLFFGWRALTRLKDED